MRVAVATLPLLLAPLALAQQQQQCVPLSGSSICPAFNQSRISTSQRLQGFYPFLSTVTNPQSFDSEIQRYVNTTFAQQKFQGQNQFGCSNVDLTNTTNLYARYTYSYICNAIIQLSMQECGVAAGQPGSQPLCSSACTEFADSEGTIISSPQLCGRTGSNAMAQLRADFQQCVEPSDSLTDGCIPGYQNEGTDCGFQYNLEGLCQYCSTSSVNNTDSCCRTSQAEARCANVKLPTFSSMSISFTTTATVTPTSTPTAVAGTASPSRDGLSGGQIAGIVVGSVAGAAVLLGLLICCCLFVRRRRRQREESSLNQPTPPMSRDKNKKGEKFEAAPGARVTRMAALEASSSASTPHNAIGSSHYLTPTDGAKTPRSPAGFGAIAVSRRDKSRQRTAPVDDESPDSQGYSSGDGAATGQSEQMDAFKDYYSNDDIHPGDMVSTLWAYTPRANDEFELERGDMLRIVGIWDDGWATGVRVSDRAEDWELGQNPHRDSGVSGNGAEEQSPPASGDVKAFPHWKKTIEGEANEPEMSDGDHTE